MADPKDERVWCVCSKCSTSIISTPGTPCPGCHKGVLKKDWADHVSIEDTYPDGDHILVIRRSRNPIKGHYCTLHETNE